MFWVFFVESLPNPVVMPELSNWSSYQNFPTGRRARTFQLVSQQSLASINNKNPQNFNKRPPVATTIPSGTQRHHWGIGIPGIPSDLRSRPEQSHHFPGALLPRWLQVVYRVSNGHPHLQLYRNGAYIHYLWLYSENTAKKGVLFDES